MYFWYGKRSREPAPPGSGHVTLACCLLAVLLPLSAMVFLIGYLNPFFPTDFSAGLGGFLASALAILVVAFAAPASHRARFAAGTAILTVAVLGILFLHYLHGPMRGILVAAVGAAALVLWVIPGRRARKRWFAVLVSAGYAVLLVGCFLDWPAFAGPFPEFGFEGAKNQRSAITRFYAYSLGGGIDHEWLWRVDARPETLEAIATQLEMMPRTAAPDDFWIMPPYYWPRSMPKGGRLYSSPSFPSEDRGPDGHDYFMLIDPRRSSGFIWFKDNF